MGFNHFIPNKNLYSVQKFLVVKLLFYFTTIIFILIVLFLYARKKGCPSSRMLLVMHFTVKFDSLSF